MKLISRLTFISLSLFISCNAVNKQFSYLYKTEIAYNNEPGFALDHATEHLALELNNNLNQSVFFDLDFLRSPAPQKREYHLKSKPTPTFVGDAYDVFTEDNVRLGATFFDRDSDTLLVIGEGFTNERELMSPFVAMFPNYDVVLMDFRGHGYRPFAFSDPETWPLSLTKMGFGVDGSVANFGVDEHKDVFAVVESFKKIKQHQNKPYKRVFGIGLCYGAFIFLKSLSHYPHIFDKLVLDGCWLSLPLYFEKARTDLKVMCNPQTGGWRDHWFFGQEWVKNSLAYLARNVFLNISNISLLDFAPRIKQEKLLFFYGKDDYVVKRHEFEQLWNALTDVEKTVILTSNYHVRNHLKEKELYKLICDLFFELPQDQLLACLHDGTKSADFFVNKLRNIVVDTGALNEIH